MNQIGQYPSVLSCRCCGTYKTSEGFLDEVINERTPHFSLSGLARELFEQGHRLLITFDNYKELERQSPATAMEKMRKLLQAIARKSTLMGTMINLNYDHDYTLGYCSNPREFQFLFEELLKTRWIIGGGDRGACLMTLDGFAEVESIKPKRSSQGFVAMRFNDAMKTVYDEGFAPAIEKPGFTAFRVDSKEHVGKIDDLIIAGIQESRFVVADFTGHRNGVYFEAGFAMGLGLPVIWTCQDDDFDQLHFDIRQYNCIKWFNADDLKFKLENRIRAVVGSSKV